LGTFVVAILAVALLSWLIVRWWRPSAYTATPEAQAWYEQGVAALFNGAFLQATKAFEQAVASDPNFSLAHARLAEVATELDYPDKAKDEMIRALPSGQEPSSLPTRDALYVQAIRSTVARNYPDAIRAYEELARLSPTDAQVYVDLGRAYEKNEEGQKAIESYVKATNLAPQNATAFLRLAMLYGKQMNLASATANFDKADQLYQALGNYEGQTEVAYQRGFLFNQQEKNADARRELERSIDLARTTNNQYAKVKALLKLGDVAAAEGNVSRGQDYIREAIDLAQANGIDKYVKRGLADLGNNYLLSRDYEAAEKSFKESLQLSQRQHDSQNTARASLCLASLAERQANPDLSVSYTEQALALYKQGGYRKEISQATSLLARAKRRKGDYQGALTAFEEQLKLAVESGDQSSMILVHGDIGLVFMNQARYPEALTHFQESYALAKSAGNKNNQALGLINQANALWNLGRYSEARSLFAEASQIAEAPNANRNIAGWYFLSLARMAISERNFAEARKHAEHALSLASSVPTVSPTFETLTLGSAESFLGATRDGRKHCEKAVEMADNSKDPALQSAAQLALAQILLESGDAAAALAAALKSQGLFSQMGKQDGEWFALTLAARASSKTRDHQHARDYAERADSLLSDLRQKWGEDYYGSYIARADVKFLRMQLNELVAQRQ
jgi:tetratricopeptide (TPR) repeat protein